MSALASAGSLIRLIWRRDRIILLLWIAVVSLLPMGIAASFAGLYATEAALRAFADESMRTPAAVAMLGQVFSPTVGGLVAWRSGLQSAILIAPVSLLLVIRHTRTEEESGRRELLSGTVVGRLAPLAAALLVVLAADLLIATLMAGGLIAVGLPPAGAIAFGLSSAAAGWIFAAVGAVAAQLTQGPAAAQGMGLAAFALAYMLRVPSDLGGPAWLSWLSPLGWVRHTRAFAGEQWWVFGLAVGLVAALVALAFALAVRRDLGAGLLPSRPGPAAAAPGLRSPLALAWRLQRGPLLAWAVALAVLGSLIGAIGRSIAGFVDVPQFKDWMASMGASNAADVFLFMFMYVLAQVVAVYAILGVLRLRTEEVEGRAESVLAAAVSRPRWASSHLALAALGPAVLLAVLGLGVGLIYGLSMGDLGHQLPRMLARALFALPAVWVMAGLAAALYGWLPRFAGFITWAVLAVVLVLELGWELRQVSQAVFSVSPFAHVHWSSPLAVAPVVGLAALAALLAGMGLAGFSRRDVG